jgi:hypothetical protein
MIFIGYESGSKAYRTYDPSTNCVHVTRDVVFNEQAQWNWGSGSDNSELGSGDGVFTVDYIPISQAARETKGVNDELGKQSMLPATNDDVEVDNDINDYNLHANHDIDYDEVFMVKGFTQRHDIDYDEVFTSVAWLDSVRLFTALAAHEGLEVHHMDVKLAFFNSDL